MTLLKGIEGESLDESRLQELNVERLLVGFLRSLLDEQRAELGLETDTVKHAEFIGGGHT